MQKERINYYYIISLLIIPCTSVAGFVEEEKKTRPPHNFQGMRMEIQARQISRANF